MFGRSNANFDRLLEKATSQLLLEPDWSSIMAICDSIRQNDTNPKYAVTAIKKKFYHTNPHVSLYALQVMESCVKNCGVLVHEEVATKAFMEEMRDLVKQSTDENIKTKSLELLQTWGMAFRNSPKYRIATDTLNLMKAEGWKFPPVREAEAMFEADTAPEWAEGEVCNRCRVQFTTFTRQHHCRACGQVFCAKCSSKSCVLPKFGIEREVRVCDSCFDKYGPSEAEGAAKKGPDSEQTTTKTTKSDLPAEYLSSPLSKQPQEPPGVAKNGGKSEAEIKEEEELQLVLALSKSQAEEEEKRKKKTTSELMTLYSSSNGVSEAAGKAAPGQPEGGMAEPELEKYLDREYWEGQRERQGQQQQQELSGVAAIKAQVAANSGVNSGTLAEERLQGAPNGMARGELEEFTASLKTQLEMFVNRMKSNSSRGRPIANDSSVQTLFMNVMTLHGRLVGLIQEEECGRVRLEGLQDRLSQVRDAMAALEALREEEEARRRAEAEELERQRQVQLAAKLEVMRKKKAEYLEYQRQLALQRMAEQEREVAKKAEASKAAYMQQYGMGFMPYGYQQPPAPGHPQAQGQVMPPQHQVMLPPGVAHPGHMQPPGPGFHGQAQLPGLPGPAGEQHPPVLAPAPAGVPQTAPPTQPLYPGYPGFTQSSEQQQPGNFNMSSLGQALPTPTVAPQPQPYQPPPQPQPYPAPAQAPPEQGQGHPLPTPGAPEQSLISFD